MSLFMKIETQYKDSKSQDSLRFRNDQHYILERNGVLLDYATNLSLSLSLSIALNQIISLKIFENLLLSYKPPNCKNTIYFSMWLLWV